MKKPHPILNLNPHSKEYCNYHKDSGQTTTNYRNYKEFIEDLLARGQRWEFVAKKVKEDRQNGDHTTALGNKDDRDEGHAKIHTLCINCIYGAQKYVGSTSKEHRIA